jgi:hypothetical protein
MMMRWSKGSLLGVAAAAGILILPVTTLAQDPEDTNVGVTEKEIEDIDTNFLENPLILTLRGGPINYQDSDGEYTSRMSEGINAFWNITNDAGVKLGLETGFQYSHIGAAGSDFFGSDAPSGASDAGANSFVVPLQAVAGFHLTDSLFLSAHGGASLIYSSIGTSMQTGRESDESTDSSTEVFPSASLQAGLGLGTKTALTLRGDYIPTGADDIVVATLGLGLGL